jgi:predicted GNAT family acetyltransferase
MPWNLIGNAMAHPLDRPAWSALTARQSYLAQGDGRALRFDADYALFAAAADDSADALTALAALVPVDGAVGLVEARNIPLPQGLVVKSAICNQMIADRVATAQREISVTALGDADAQEMLALATLTQPGPFFRKTHKLGDFIGVKEDGKLVAMAGERMKPTGFTEVSGVCTHPDHRGKGYAGGLMGIVAQKILTRGEIPFLHVYADNAGAIALYETLGFRLRATMHFTLISRGSIPLKP